MKRWLTLCLCLLLWGATLPTASVHAQQETPPRQDEADQLLNTCYEHYVNGQFEEAIRTCTLALPMYQALGNDALTAVTLTNLGLSHLSLDQLDQARTYFEQALPLYRALGDRYGEAWALNNSGFVYYRQIDYDRAGEFYGQALDLWRTDIDPVGLATTLNNLGLLTYAQTNYEQAVLYFEESAEIWSSVENFAAAADSFNNLGLAYHAAAQYPQALSAYDSALRLWQQIGNLRGQAWAHNNRGLSHAALLNYAQAIEEYRQALALQADLNYPLELAQTHNNLGLAHSGNADYPQALTQYRLALDIYQRLDDRWNQANVLTNMGFALKSSTQYEEALAAYQQALEIWIEVGHRAGEASAQQGLGDVHQARAAYQQALFHYQAARDLWHALDLPMQEAYALLSIGITYQSLGDTAQAMRYYRQGITMVGDINPLLAMAAPSPSADGQETTPADPSLAGQTPASLTGRVESVQSLLEITNEMIDLIEKGTENNTGVTAEDVQKIAVDVQMLFSHLSPSSNRSEEAMRLTVQGYIEGVLGNYTGAVEALTQAYDLWSAVGDQANAARVQQYLGQIWTLQEEPDAALAAYQQALALQQQIGDRSGEAITLASMGALYLAAGDSAGALDYALDAVAVLESIYSELKVESLQTTFASGTAGVYHFVVSQLLAGGDAAEAFHYAERSRARTLLTLLGNQRINPKGSEKNELIEREIELRGQIVELERQLRDLWASPPSAQRESQLAQIKEEMEIRRAEYEELLTDLQLTNPEYAGLISVPPFGLDEAQAMLRQGAPDLTLLVYLVGVEETVIFVIGADAFHAETVAVPQWELRQEVEALRAQMKTGLLLPDAWRTPAQRLYQWLIAPVEAYLPAADADTPPSLAVIPHEALHYLPFGLLHTPDADPSTELLLDGYRLSYAPSVSSLQFVLARAEIDAADLISFASPQAPGAPYLAYAEREAGAVAAIFQANPLIGDEASEGQFKQRAGDYGLVHIAAHSEYNGQNPLFSAILLSPDAGEDGRLETHEIFNLDLAQTDLVVLSACETHLGQLSSGDELVGLERAFLRAGASSLLSTLWPVDDVVTAYFMESFYTHLSGGMTKADALRLAQQETRRVYPEPYFWAGMVLVGAAH